jgi:hypothetical protein
MDLSDFADLGKIWEGWGGVWGGAFNDPIHFELPGFPHAAAAKKATEGLSLRDWILKEYGTIPWWISAVLPIGTTLQAATSEKTTLIRKLVQKLGLV